MTMHLAKKSPPLLAASFVALISIATLSACSMGFSPSTSPCVGSGCNNTSSGGGGSGGNGGGSGGDTGGTTPADQWSKTEFDLQVGSGAYSGTPVVRLDKQNKMLLVTVPLPSTSIGVYGGDVTIQGLPGARISFEDLGNGTTGIVLHVPLRFVVRKDIILPPDRLPNGDPLPGVADGEMPSIGVQLPTGKKSKTSLYLGVGSFAVFVSTPVDPYLAVRVPLMNKEKTRRFGYLYTVPAKGNSDGGFFLSLVMPGDLARLIDSVL